MVTLRGTKKKKTFSAALMVCLVVVDSNIAVDICTHVLFEKVESKMNSMIGDNVHLRLLHTVLVAKMLNLKRK